MKICLVTTYPEFGSKNIGDALITKCTLMFLKEVYGEAVDVTSIWRASEWQKVKPAVESSDLVVFACLAIRKDMTTKEYPYLWNIIQSGKKIAVLASGTNFSSGSREIDFDKSISLDTKAALQQLGKISSVFSSRGFLTHLFLHRVGVKQDVFTGDIAFFDRRFIDRRFVKVRSVKRIAISDPHRGKAYWPTMRALLFRLKEIFPEAEPHILLHGLNPFIETELEKLGVRVNRIYEDPNHGLDEYDGYDIHVGFRVHGHVSALSRRIPSYLLEQDGRGSEYGLTLNRRCSVPCHLSGVKSPVDRFLRRLKLPFNAETRINTEAVEKLSAMLMRGRDSQFSNFLGFEQDLVEYVENFKNLENGLID